MQVEMGDVLGVVRVVLDVQGELDFALFAPPLLAVAIVRIHVRAREIGTLSIHVRARESSGFTYENDSHPRVHLT